MSEAHSDPFVPSPRPGIEDHPHFGGGRRLAPVPRYEAPTVAQDPDATQEFTEADMRLFNAMLDSEDQNVNDAPEDLSDVPPTPVPVLGTDETTPPTPPRRSRRGFWVGVSAAVAAGVSIAALAVTHSGGDEKEQNTTSDAALDQAAKDEV
ncbi:hypothetical protein KDA23_00865, partial [Candidatus Saccharibacteria bacterium]|nr:hypothetical protein [Candidatus Saccharibacteria bacterium]